MDKTTYEIIDDLRNENKYLKEEIEKWQIADRRAPVTIIFIGIFVFIPIGVIIGGLIANS